jgi:hypothetical protein
MIEKRHITSATRQVRHFKKQQMTRIFIIISFGVLTSFAFCDNSYRKKTTGGLIDNSIEKGEIKRLFIEWQTREIKAKHFFPKDWCNPDSFMRHNIIKENLDSIKGLIYGFPSDSTEYKFSFADLNNDGKLDGLVVFVPDQCDGGNASMWKQWQVFLLSKNGNYEITDTLHVNSFASTSFDSLGFYWLDSIATDKIFGTYFEFKAKDGHCCPSIQRPVTFDFIEKKLSFIGDNIDRK